MRPGRDRVGGEELMNVWIAVTLAVLLVAMIAFKVIRKWR